MDASIRIHSRIGIVVFEGTALDTIPTPLTRFDLLHIIFMSRSPFVKVWIKLSACAFMYLKRKLFRRNRRRGCGKVDNYPQALKHRG